MPQQQFRDEALVEIAHQVGERRPLPRKPFVEQCLDGPRIRPLREQRPSLDRIQVLGDSVDHPMSCLMKLFRVHQRSSVIRSVATMRPLSGCTGRLFPWMIARNL
jgi:hypothetical protein